MSPEARPPRLNRLDRLFVSHPLYFITACTEDRKPILANTKVHEDFMRFCEAGMERGVFVSNYVLMPDHLHLFVAFGDEYEAALVASRLRRSQTDATGGVGRSQTDAVAGVGRSQTDATNVSRDSCAPVAAVCDRRFSPLSEWMKSLKNSPSKTLRGMNIPAPHWQKGFFDHVMRSEESYSEKWLYVAENPVRKHLVARPEDWPYQGEIYPL
jgi:REP element-mobilizing transposase RayT